MKLPVLLLLFFLGFHSNLFAQNYPWERPLKMAWSLDGITFASATTFQDSSGVPSVVQWKGDTLICAFQWFRQPIGSAGWDRVAVKFSYDAGLTWTDPEPIVLNGIPSGYQRPFDPALSIFSGDSIRIYFSSSESMPAAGQDSIIDTYSAKSVDGIHYEFEINPRVNVSSARVIDPTVIYFNNSFHYIAPVGSPSQGAYHYVSPDGINFIAVPLIPSDSVHNWTGNYMIENSSELRFYGSGPTTLWYNSTSNGGMWNGYIHTNVHGGDPSVVKTTAGSYLMIYTGDQYPTFVNETNFAENAIYPNPASSHIFIDRNLNLNGELHFYIFDLSGRVVIRSFLKSEKELIDITTLDNGFYLILLKTTRGNLCTRFLKVEK